MKQTKFKVAILVDCSSGWGRRLIRGIANYSLKAGNWQLLVEEKSQNELLHLPQGWHGDGIIARVSNTKLYKELIATGKPIINISGIRLQGVDLPRVSTDYHAAALLAVQHFHERGFRNLATVEKATSPTRIVTAKPLLEAAEALTLNCHVFNSQRPSSEAYGMPNALSYYNWLETLPKPVGVLTWGTQRGRDLLNICNEFNITAPESVAVLAGDDDELLCEVCYPPHVRYHHAGRRNRPRSRTNARHATERTALTPDSKFFPPTDVDTRLSTDTLAIGDPSLTNAIRFIRDNIRKPIQVSDIADCSSIVSPRPRACALQVRSTHSPAREISNARLTLAKKLSRETRLSIADIAAKSGYSTP